MRCDGPVVAAAYVPPVLATVVLENGRIVEVRRHAVHRRTERSAVIRSRLVRCVDDAGATLVIGDPAIAASVAGALTAIVLPGASAQARAAGSARISKRDEVRQLTSAAPELGRFFRRVPVQGARGILARAETAVLSACLTGLAFARAPGSLEAEGSAQ